MERIHSTLYQVLEADHPMTVRQVFYQMVSRGAVAKTEGQYKGTVCRLLAEMRLAHRVPFGWVADNTRWMRKPKTYTSVEEALRQCAQTYRRALWDNQGAYVEVWCEKDALAGVLLEETRPWDVPLMVTRGFPSISYLFEASEAIEGLDKPAYLYYFGDHDPSGVHIDRTIERRLREFAPGAEIHFERVAVLPRQVRELGLPTRPTKKGGNGHAKGFQGDSVELDAIPAQTLRRMARQCIERHVDRHAYEVLREAEQSERELLTGIANTMGEFSDA
jgi:hypothetical protein